MSCVVTDLPRAVRGPSAWLRFLLPAALLALAFAQQAQGAGPPAAAAPVPGPSSVAAPVPPDPFGRETPFGTVKGFLDAMAHDDVRRATVFLEGSQSARLKEELATELKQVLDRGAQLRREAISRQPEGQLDDGLPRDLEQVGTVSFGDRGLDLLLRRVEPRGQGPIWLVSSETLRRVPEAAEQLEARLPERIWPEALRERSFLAVPLFAWINTALVLPLSVLAAWGISRLVMAALLAGLRRRAVVVEPADAARLRGACFLLALGLAVLFLAPLAASVRSRVFWTSAGTGFSILALAWALVSATRVAIGMKVRQLRIAGKPGRIAIYELAKWGLLGIWTVVALFLVLRSFGVDLSAAVAGLGVGGIAVALAAQKTLGNLFGTMTLVGDEVLRVGDECRIGNIEGWVHSIGLQSTRIRSRDRSLVTIANGQLATMNVDNLQMRDKYLCRHMLQLAKDASALQLRRVLADTRALLGAHPDFEADSVIVRLCGIGESSFDVEFRGYVLVREWKAFVRIQEELLLHVLDIVERSGARLALPSRLTYFGPGAAADARFEAAPGELRLRDAVTSGTRQRSTDRSA